jgi:hypothetical protein
MTLGRYSAIFAALVMLAWPLALTAAQSAAEGRGMISHSSAMEHCQPGEIEINGDCSYIVLCAQLCIGVMPAGAGGATVSPRLSRLPSIRAQTPEALTHVPPKPPPRKLRFV